MQDPPLPQGPPQPQPQPVDESQPLEPIPAQPQEPSPVQPSEAPAAEGGSGAKIGPSFAEILSSPNPAASGHERYDDIAEILTIAYEYWTGDRARDAELIWLGLGRVFGREVLPEPIRIVE